MIHYFATEIMYSDISIAGLRHLLSFFPSVFAVFLSTQLTFSAKHTRTINFSLAPAPKASVLIQSINKSTIIFDYTFWLSSVFDKWMHKDGVNARQEKCCKNLIKENEDKIVMCNLAGKTTARGP